MSFSWNENNNGEVNLALTTHNTIESLVNADHAIIYDRKQSRLSEGQHPWIDFDEVINILNTSSPATTYTTISAANFIPTLSTRLKVNLLLYPNGTTSAKAMLKIRSNKFGTMSEGVLGYPASEEYFVGHNVTTGHQNGKIEYITQNLSTTEDCRIRLVSYK